MKKIDILIIVALSTTVLLFIYSLFGRLIHVDDGILAEPAYWLTQTGHLRSEALRGWQFAEDKFLFSHKLFLYIGALFIQIFGWSIYSVKAVSLCYLIGLAYIWKKIFHYHNISATYYLAFILLILTYGQIYELSFVFRPEVGIAFYASCLYLFLQIYLDRSNWTHLLIAGGISALAIGHHLNSVVIVGGACLLLLLHKKPIPFFIYGFISSFGLLFFLLGVNSTDDFNLMIQQFKFQQDISSEHFSSLRYIFNIINEHKRYLHSPQEITFTLFIIASFIANKSHLLNKYRNLILFTLISALFLAIIAHGKTSKYLTILVPLYAFIIVISLPKIFAMRPKVASLLIGLFLIGQWSYNYRFTFQKDQYTPSLHAFDANIEKGKNILGPIYGVFWAIPNYRYQAFMPYQWRSAHNQFSFNPESLNSALEEYDIDYIIFNNEFWERFKMQENSLPSFRYERRSGDLRLFKRLITKEVL